MRPEDLSHEMLVEFVKDLFHRVGMHETIWFREIEHQFGYKRALQSLDYAWPRSKEGSEKRMAKYMPLDLHNMSKEQLLEMAADIAKNWVAMDGVWFQSVEFTDGLFEAKRCNDTSWFKFSPIEAVQTKKLLGLGEHPGLEGLEDALYFRLYSIINKQHTEFKDGALILTLEECRVQSARMRKGLEDYPCKSAGISEYRAFATGFDDRIKTECICCPPDDHPADCICCWKFTIQE